MIGLNVVLYGVIGVLLAVVRTWHIAPVAFSRFELQRRVKAGDKRALHQQTIEQYRAEIAGSFWLIQAVCIVVLVCSAFAQLPPVWAVVMCIGVILISNGLSRMSIVERRARRGSVQVAQWVVAGVKRYGWLGWLLRGAERSTVPKTTIHSQEELTDLLSHLGHEVIAPRQKELLLQSLAFDDSALIQVMTPRQQMTSLSARELLGPLVVNELHQTGQQWFLVTEGDDEVVVGVIHLRQLVDVRSGTSRKASEVMQQDVERVADSQDIRTTLAQLLASDASMALVIDDSGAVSGVVTVQAIVAKLIPS